MIIEVNRVYKVRTLRYYGGWDTVKVCDTLTEAQAILNAIEGESKHIYVLDTPIDNPEDGNFTTGYPYETHIKD